MQTLNVQSWSGNHKVKVRKNGVGVLNQDASNLFTCGHCHSLALAVNKLTGWKMFAVGDEHYSPQHFIMYCPPLKDYIDVNGPKAVSRYKRLASRLLEEFDPAEIDQLEFYKEPDPEMAEPFAKALLIKLSVEHDIDIPAVRELVSKPRPRRKKKIVNKV